MQETHSAWVVAAGGLLVAMGLVATLYAVPELVRGMVSEKVALKDGSEAMARFRRTPQPLHFHVYLFHVENPEEVSGQGARPVLAEKGPYVYDMYRERVDLKFHDEDDTVSYLGKSTYFFNRSKSGCRSDSDEVTVIHAPILGTALKLQQVSSMGLGIFNDAVPLLFTAKNIFLTTTVRELLFDGVFINCSFPEDSFPAGAVCQGLRQRAPASYRRQGADFYFSMFGHLNGTSHERVRVSRGQRDAGAVGRIRAVAGNATLSAWRPGTPCNLVNGTDGTIFPPFLRGTAVLPIYTAASCRSLNLLYKNDTDLNGVPVLRFVIDANMLASGRDYPANRCFCVIPPQESAEPDEEEEEVSGRRRRAARAQPSVEEQELQACLPRGAMSLAACSGSPVVLTFPHFYLGDESFLKYPVGLRPSEADHQTVVDIEPVTGIPLRAMKRVQLNMFLKKIEDFNYLSSVSEGLFPILWMEEGITLQGESFDKIAAAGRSLAVVQALPWVLVALGGALLVGGLAFLSGMAQSAAGLCRPSKPPRVQQQQQQQLGDVSADSRSHRMSSIGFGSGDLALGFPQKAAHVAGHNVVSGNMAYRGRPSGRPSGRPPAYPYHGMYPGEYKEAARQRPAKIIS